MHSLIRFHRSTTLKLSLVEMEVMVMSCIRLRRRRHSTLQFQSFALHCRVRHMRLSFRTILNGKMNLIQTMNKNGFFGLNELQSMTNANLCNYSFDYDTDQLFSDGFGRIPCRSTRWHSKANDYRLDRMEKEERNSNCRRRIGDWGTPSCDLDNHWRRTKPRYDSYASFKSVIDMGWRSVRVPDVVGCLALRIKMDFWFGRTKEVKQSTCHSFPRTVRLRRSRLTIRWRIWIRLNQSICHCMSWLTMLTTTPIQIIAKGSRSSTGLTTSLESRMSGRLICFRSLWTMIAIICICWLLSSQMRILHSRGFERWRIFYCRMLMGKLFGKHAMTSEANGFGGYFCNSNQLIIFECLSAMTVQTKNL